MKSLTAAVRFVPKSLTTTCGLTAVQVKAELARIGVVFATGADDFSVRVKGQTRDDAYHTDDLDDALVTGRSMI